MESGGAGAGSLTPASYGGGPGAQRPVGRPGRAVSDALLKLIDQKGKTDVEVYKKANIDASSFPRFERARATPPKKPTILALAIALE